MLVKRWLTEYVSRIDTEAEGQNMDTVVMVAASEARWCIYPPN